MRKKLFIFSFLLLTFALVEQAEAQETFTIATLNVDGLPLSVLGIDVNPDGPGSEGTVRISEYLAKKGYDIVMMQEDFNYHEELTTHLTDKYVLDEWSGGLNVEDYDFTNPNFRFTCDGLMAAIRTGDEALSQSGKAITLAKTERTAWEDYYGRMDHAWDGMVTKGFRRYELTLAGGTEIVVYNMHMDAEEDGDDASGDREAREGQWKQLCEEITERLNERPIIVLGDMNSQYDCDPIKELFIDKIAATGKATVGDSWTLLGNDGVEVLDKILYVNPVDGQQLTPIDYLLDKTDYMYEDKPLGDHFPVVVTFKVEEKGTGISDIVEDKKNGESAKYGLYDLSGRRINPNARLSRGIYFNERYKVITAQ